MSDLAKDLDISQHALCAHGSTCSVLVLAVLDVLAPWFVRGTKFSTGRS